MTTGTPSLRFCSHNKNKAKCYSEPFFLSHSTNVSHRVPAEPRGREHFQPGHQRRRRLPTSWIQNSSTHAAPPPPISLRYVSWDFRGTPARGPLERAARGDPFSTSSCSVPNVPRFVQTSIRAPFTTNLTYNKPPKFIPLWPQSLLVLHLGFSSRAEPEAQGTGPRQHVLLGQRALPAQQRGKDLTRPDFPLTQAFY